MNDHVEKKLSLLVSLLVSLALMLGFIQNSWADKSPKPRQGASWEPEQIIFLPWGKGRSQAGKLECQEGASEGPAHFALSLAGELYLLDQVNCRILKINQAGAWVSQFPIPMSRPCLEGATYGYIEVSPGGEIVLLDPTVKQVLVVLDPTGKETARYNLAELGIPARKDQQAITEMFFAEDGLYLDYRKFFNNALKPVKGNKYPGRPFEGKGKYLTYNINYDNNNNEYRIILRVEAPESPVNEKEKVITVKDIEGLVVNLVDSDLHNNIYLVYNYWKRDQKTHKITKKSYIGIKYNEQFNQISQFQFIPKDMLDLDYTKNVRLTQEGKLYLMHFTPKGVQILRWP